MITIHTDGASKGNPGRTGWGFWSSDGYEEFGTCGVQTCNYAEMEAVVKALEYYVGKEEEIKFLMDSKLASNILEGNWKCKNQNIKSLYQKMMVLKAQYKTVKALWIPRERNYRADHLANLGAEMPLSKVNFSYSPPSVIQKPSLF